ncbi:MAG: hypothetical protein R3F48_05060 [Candidatus Zixiibacteriota bacterium]
MKIDVRFRVLVVFSALFTAALYLFSFAHAMTRSDSLLCNEKLALLPEYIRKFEIFIEETQKMVIELRAFNDGIPEKLSELISQSKTAIRDVNELIAQNSSRDTRIEQIAHELNVIEGHILVLQEELHKGLLSLNVNVSQKDEYLNLWINSLSHDFESVQFKLNALETIISYGGNPTSNQEPISQLAYHEPADLTTVFIACWGFVIACYTLVTNNQRSPKDKHKLYIWHKKSRSAVASQKQKVFKIDLSAWLKWYVLISTILLCLALYCALNIGQYAEAYKKLFYGILMASPIIALIFLYFCHDHYEDLLKGKLKRQLEVESLRQLRHESILQVLDEININLSTRKNGQ